MKFTVTALTILAASSGMALAAGDVEAGAKVFKQCQTCHVVVDPDGKVLAGKNAKVGPNLYGVIGRPAASYEGFKYGDGIMEAAAAGLVWDEAGLAEYVLNPTAYIDKVSGDAKAKSKMAFKLKKPEDGVNVAAFLASLAPAAAAPAEGEAAPADGAAAPAVTE
jgi:cytochrome c